MCCLLTGGKHIEKPVAMNELNLYKLIQDIVNGSYVMEGRFVVLNGKGKDLNADNFSNIVYDALGGMTSERKFPLVALFPPVNFPDYIHNWNHYPLRMFFLTTVFNTGDGDIKEINPDARISDHTKEQCWADMERCANDFRRMFNIATMQPAFLNKIREKQPAGNRISRFTNVGNADLAGVELSFGVELAMDCNVTDYDTTVTIPAPTVNPHPQHKQ